MQMVTTRTQQLATAVRDARLARGMTQAELAKAAGVHTQTIGNLERAAHEPTADLVTKLTRVLKLDLSTSSLAAQQSVEHIEQSLLARLANMDDAQRLIFVGEVMRYVTDWQADPD